MQKIGVRLLLALAVLAGACPGEEGFWLLRNLAPLHLPAHGLKIGLDDIFHPQRPALAEAVILINGEGTGAFVSAEGLILTNFHNISSALQRLSRPGRDYYKDGFLAASRPEELSAEGFEAQIVIDTLDVTGEVEAAVAGVADADARMKILQTQLKEFASRLAPGDPDRSDSRVSLSMRSSKWYALRSVQILDLRIVYAPPLSLSRFGGEVDDWRWPSYPADFAFLRAYVGPDGKSRSYAPDNVPYRPGKRFEIDTRGVDEDDFVFCLGFPGNSFRYRTSSDIDYELRLNLPWEMKIYRKALEAVETHMRSGEAAAVKLAGRRDFLESRLINRKGTLEGLAKSRLVERKKREEKAAEAFLRTRPQTAREDAGLFEAVENLRRRNNQTAAKEFVLAGWMMFCEVFNTAREILELGREVPVPEEDLRRIRRRIENRGLDLYVPLDRDLFRELLRDAVSLPPELRLPYLDRLFGGKSGSDLELAIQAFAEAVYGRTILADTGRAISLVGMDRAGLLSLGDPMIEFVAGISDDLLWFDEWHMSYSREKTGLENKLQRLMKEWKGEAHYPDSDLTLRLSYGRVKGYDPAEAVHYDPFTTTKGLRAKNTGLESFALPGRFAELVGEGESPVSFLTTLDIIGGSSGSPVLNGEGKLVGLVYDRNFESMIAEYAYFPDLTRTMCLDMRFILFVTDKFAGAGFILDEIRR